MNKKEYEKYYSDLEKIIDIEDEEVFNKEYKDLYKKYNIIFRYKLGDAWDVPYFEIIITDNIKDNVLIIEEDSIENITLSSEEIDKIKSYLNNKDLYKEESDVAFPPVLDGTSHIITMSYDNNFKDISCSNIWYWIDEDIMKSDKSNEEKEYTSLIIKTLTNIEKVLNKHDVVLVLYLDDEDIDEE